MRTMPLPPVSPVRVSRSWMVTVSVQSPLSTVVIMSGVMTMDCQAVGLPGTAAYCSV